MVDSAVVLCVRINGSLRTNASANALNVNVPLGLHHVENKITPLDYIMLRAS